MLTPDHIRLDGRVVVVTGAANGIGRATALMGAQFGADVAVCDRDADGLASLATEMGPSARALLTAELDVRDEQAVTAFVAAVGDRFGAVHGLVNNAGGTFRAAFTESSAKGDQALIAENFSSVLNVTRATVALMPETGGSVVNVTSSEAFQAAPGFAVYAAMKSGVESLTRTLALELALRKVRVNSVSPDGIRTAADASLAADVQQSSDFLPPPRPPVGHFADPSDCASVILFLLGDLARFVTGSAVHVDGGLHAAGGWHRRVDPV